MDGYDKFKGTFETEVEQFVLEDPRYSADAYYFMRNGFDFAKDAIEEDARQDGKAAPHGISGAQLSRELVNFAIDEYGPMAAFTLAEWGIKTTEDFGEIIYNLIKMGFMLKNDNDAKEDFSGLFDLQKELRAPFD